MATTEQDVLSGNRALARSFLDTLSGGDLEQVWAFFDEDSTWTVCAVDILGAGAARGRAIIDEFLTPVRGLFEPGNPKVEVKRVVAEGSSVVVEAEGHGRFLNGSPYDNVYCFVLDVEGTKIRSIREYMDTGYAGRVVAEVTGESGA